CCPGRLPRVRGAVGHASPQEGLTVTKDVEVIRWRDSGMHLASEEWTAITSVRARAAVSGMEVTTVGMLVHEDDDVVVLGLSIDETGDTVFGAQAIWKACILERCGLDEISAA
ncbi:MAG: hypothetical protein ACREBE_20175, partial [bacterium]